MSVEPHLDPTVRHDMVFLFDVTDGNPNGDPDGLRRASGLGEDRNTMTPRSAAISRAAAPALQSRR